MQETFAPKSICFGCGPANGEGLRIRSFESPGPGIGSAPAGADAKGQGGTRTVATWSPSPRHQAFPGMLNGGIIGALLDCHSNWAAAMHLMRRNGWDRPHATVTAEFKVELLAPVPSGSPVELSAEVEEATERKAVVSSTLSSGGVVKARCRATFVAVKEGHPAYHRWE